MYAALPGEVLLQQIVDQAMPFDLRLVLELVRRDDEPKMGLGGRAVGHGLVVLMEVGIVVDLEARGDELVADLYTGLTRPVSLPLLSKPSLGALASSRPLAYLLPDDPLDRTTSLGASRCC